MNWRPVSEVAIDELIHHANVRGRVRLRSGQICTLVSWPRRGDRVSGLRCRLETLRGSRFSLRIEQVEEIEITEKGTPMTTSRRLPDETPPEYLMREEDR